MNQPYIYYSKNNLYIHHSIDGQRNRDGYPAESHHRIELLLLLSGKLNYVINGTAFPVHPGDLIVVGAGELHALQIDASEPYERIVVQFSPKYIPKLREADFHAVFADSYRYQHTIPKTLVKKHKIDKLLHKLVACIALEPPYRDLSILSHLMNLIAGVHRASTQLLENPTNVILPVSKAPTLLLKNTIEYVNNNLTKPITAESAAMALGISKDYLYHFFKEQMGMPFRQYVQTQKMQLAYLLIQKGYSAQNTAEYLGFEYYATFFAQYKRAFRKSPSQHSKNPANW